jgi:molybdate transport system ATP-binding protein
MRIASAARLGENEILAVLSLDPKGRGARLLARVTRRSWDRLGLTEGMEVYAQIKSVALALPAGKLSPRSTYDRREVARS